MTMKQFFCRHWFDVTKREAVEFSAGMIIATQRRVYRATDETRVCSKCGLKEMRRLDTVCTGWD